MGGGPPAGYVGLHFFSEGFSRRALGWYHSHFPLPHRLIPRRITFEATPEYLYDPDCAERIHLYSPKMKLITLLRDPIERAFSAWNMYRVLAEKPESVYFPLAESRDFDRAVREEIDNIPSERGPRDPSYVTRGIYHEQLLRYFGKFDCSQILVVVSQRLRTETPTVLNEITAFLGLCEHAWDENQLTPHHVGKYQTRIPPRTHKLLSEYYRPHNERLYGLLGEDFGWE